MVDPDKIKKYLDDLCLQLGDLEKFSVPNKEFFVQPKNSEKVKAIKYTLLIAIEDVVHITAHLVAALGLGRPSVSNAGDLIQILGKHNIIPISFANEITGMANFRNRLVHEYFPGELDPEKLYENLQKTDDFRKFAQYIVEFLERQEKEE